ncbi:hypothetical protein CSUI_007889 [Cystoisospora suis]|uniref:Transmembrane protein n=1 Tax=Cystoisospora suis TaxID=483139 RepID=A0A2C6KPI7_9APIC|nr:hypothetical protein CSUI_007889 [Cystoisospora suis]
MWIFVVFCLCVSRLLLFLRDTPISHMCVSTLFISFLFFRFFFLRIIET